eukprot:RCo043878
MPSKSEEVHADAVTDLLSTPQDRAQQRRAVILDQFLNKFATVHRLRHYPEDPNFCPVRASHKVAEALSVITHSWPLLRLRISILINSARRVQRCFRRFLSLRDTVLAEALARLSLAAETALKTLKSQAYKDCMMKACTVHITVRNYVKCHSTSDGRKRVVQQLYEAKREHFLKRHQAWQDTVFPLRKKLRDARREAPRGPTGSSPRCRSSSMVVAAESELKLIEAEQPSFPLSVGVFPMNELLELLSHSAITTSASMPALTKIPSASRLPASSPKRARSAVKLPPTSPKASVLSSAAAMVTFGPVCEEFPACESLCDDGQELEERTGSPPLGASLGTSCSSSTISSEAVEKEFSRGPSMFRDNLLGRRNTQGASLAAISLPGHRRQTLKGPLREERSVYLMSPSQGEVSMPGGAPIASG